jgi:hypothetical protein
MSNAAFSAAQGLAPGGMGTEQGSAGLLTRLTEIGLGAFAIAGLAYGAYLVRRRLDSIREREAMEDARMEAELRMLEIQTVGVAGMDATGAVSLNSTAHSNAIHLPAGFVDESPTGEFSPGPQPASPGEVVPADMLAPVLNQLRAGGLLEQEEDWVELHGNPKGGLVVRLRGGKRVLLVPYHETEAFARRNLRRYDGLIYVGLNGKAVFVRSVESVIADALSGNLR